MSPIEIKFDMLVMAIKGQNNPLMMQYFNTLIIDHPVYSVEMFKTCKNNGRD